MPEKQLLLGYEKIKKRQTLQRLTPLKHNNTSIEVSIIAHLYCRNYNLMKGGENAKNFEYYALIL